MRRQMRDLTIAMAGGGDAARWWAGQLRAAGVGTLLWADAALAERCGGEAVDTLDAALARRPDGVVVDVPANERFGVAMKALGAFAEVLLAGVPSGGAETLHRTAVHAGVEVVQPCLQVPLVAQLRARVERDAIGAVEAVSVTWRRRGAEPIQLGEAARVALALVACFHPLDLSGTVRRQQAAGATLIELRQRRGVDLDLRLVSERELEEPELIELAVHGDRGGHVAALLRTERTSAEDAPGARPKLVGDGRTEQLDELPSVAEAGTRLARAWLGRLAVDPLDRQGEELPAELPLGAFAGTQVEAFVDAVARASMQRDVPLRRSW